jgi:hypothetical protein
VWEERVDVGNAQVTGSRSDGVPAVANPRLGREGIQG